MNSPIDTINRARPTKNLIRKLEGFPSISTMKGNCATSSVVLNNELIQINYFLNKLKLEDVTPTFARGYPILTKIFSILTYVQSTCKNYSE